MTGLLADRKRMLLASENFDLSSQRTSDISLNIMLSDDFDIAIHEAGHGVASVVLGIGFEVISICPSTGSDVCITFRRTLRQSLEQGGVNVALQECICLMAGPAAELRLRGDLADLSSSARNDRQQLYDMSDLISQEMFLAAARLARSGGLSFDKYLPLKIQQWAWREACLMVANPGVWRAVTSLARHLEIHEAATEREALEIAASEKVRYRPKQFPAPTFASRPADIAA